MRFTIRSLMIATLTMFAAATVGAGGQSGSGASALADQSLDQLLNTPVVTVSKRQQRLSKVPAAVYVITKEEIHRSGATSIPELLRRAPGVQVARITATQWAVSIRGFNGLWSNKLLVMIDGRTIYSEMFSGVDWEMQDVILEDIERIEVVRGPGSSMWGANAMNGVINIVTKQTADTAGGMLSASAGNLDRFSSTGQYGGAVGKTGYRVYGKFADQSLPLYGGQTYPDTHKQVTGGFRIDSILNSRDTLTVQGDGYFGRTTDWEAQPVTLPSFLPTLANVDGRPSSYDVQGKWTRTLSDRSEISLQGYGMHTQRIEAGLDTRETTYDIELQHSFSIGGRNTILWGLESRTIQDRLLGTPVFYFTPVRRTDILTAGFISDEITLVPDRLELSIGMKFEKYNFTGWQPEPSARLAWTPNDNQTVWASVGRAVRIPSRYERDVTLDLGLIPGPLPAVLQVVGSPSVLSETLIAYEVGHRIKLGRKVSFDTAGYYNSYGTLRSTQQLAPELVLQARPYLLLPLVYGQMAHGTSLGLESVVNWDVLSRWRLTSTYSYGDIQASPKTGAPAGVNIYPGGLPKHQARIDSYWDVNSKLQLDASTAYINALPTQNVPSYTTVDLRVGWRPVKAIEIDAGVQNLFNRLHYEWLTPDNFLFKGKMFGRTGTVAVTWRF